MSDFLNSEFESILAEAIERVESGEMIDAVIASYPAQYRDELNDMLFVVDVVHQVSTEPVPMPSSERRAAAKQAFLASARESSADDAAAIPSAIDPTSRLGAPDVNIPSMNGRFRGDSIGHVNAPNGKGISRPRSVIEPDAPSLFDRFADWATQLLGISPTYFAPIAAALLVAIMGVSSFYTVAWSVPGDIVYPFKEWTRKVQLDVVPVEERAALVQNHDESRAEELQTAQERVDQVVDEEAEDAAGASGVDLNDAVRTGSMRSIYHGRVDGDLMRFGATDVLPRYQEDANVNAFTEIALPEGQSWADLVEGVEVEIDYQMVPGAEQFVQGMRLRIIGTPPPPVVETPTSVPTSTRESGQENAVTAPIVIAVPTATPTDRACIPSSRPGWTSYHVVRNDTLSQIANKFNVSAEELARVNCILNPNRIVPGTIYNVPTQPVVDNSTPQGQQANPSAPVATSTPTRNLLPLVPTATLATPTYTQDDTPIPSLTIPAQPGTELDETATAAATDEPTAESSSTGEPTDEVVDATATSDQTQGSGQNGGISNPTVSISVTTPITTGGPVVTTPSGPFTVTVAATLVTSPAVTAPATAVPVTTEPLTTTVPTGSVGSGDDDTSSQDGNSDAENDETAAETDVPTETETPMPDAGSGNPAPSPVPEVPVPESTPEDANTEPPTPDDGSVTTPDAVDESDDIGDGDSSTENGNDENNLDENNDVQNNDDGVGDASAGGVGSDGEGNDGESSGETLLEPPATVVAEEAPPTVQSPTSTPTQASANPQEPATTQEGAETLPAGNNQETSDDGEPSGESATVTPVAPAIEPTSTPAGAAPTPSPITEPTVSPPPPTPPTSTSVPPTPVPTATSIPPTQAPPPPEPTATTVPPTAPPTTAPPTAVPPTTAPIPTDPPPAPPPTDPPATEPEPAPPESTPEE